MNAHNRQGGLSRSVDIIYKNKTTTRWGGGNGIRGLQSTETNFVKEKKITRDRVAVL